MKPVVVAVIGCGRIANGSHFPALQALENVRIKYACDLILEKAEKDQTVTLGGAFIQRPLKAP